ncbi:hypothetical protein ACWD33_05260 [Streptomyces xiamenensis]|uniref:Secreted protein n=1 Tax=Streptomyces xiamenensis TaxID=408015 RepID=A0A0F7FU06_9ACTN|nr:hypothetical protein [Streptomyces xiamenensis]AKG43902.1 secreted protein [Streptomyces xiamenensis]
MHRRQLLRTAATSLTLAATLLATTGAAANESTAQTRWEISFSGNSPIASVYSVTSAGENTAWAAGSKDTRGVVLRWDGAGWSEDTTPGLPRVWQWSSVSAVAEDDVWAFGTLVRDPVLAHYDGTRWNTAPAPPFVGDSWPNAPIKAVPGRLFAGGEALHTYTDGVWSATALPEQVVIRDIDALGPDDAYATGMRYPVTTGHPVVHHWDGTGWTQLPTPPVPAGTELDHVTVAGPDDVYVAGYAEGEDAGPAVPAVVHWDGSSWRDITGSLSSLYLNAITADGHGGLWVTGMDQTEPAFAEPVFWHYDGTAWTKEAGALATGTDVRWPSYTFHDLAPAGDTGTFWAVGDFSAYLPDGDEVGGGLIQRSRTASEAP